MLPLAFRGECLDAGFASGLAQAVVEGGERGVVAQGQVEIGGGVGGERVVAGQRENLGSGLDRQFEADCPRDCDQGGESRVPVHRQRAVETLTLDPCCFGNLGDALRLREVAESKQQDARLVLIFECRLQVFGGKFRVPAEPTDDGLVVPNAGFPFHAVPCLKMSFPERLR